VSYFCKVIKYKHQDRRPDSSDRHINSASVSFFVGNLVNNNAVLSPGIQLIRNISGIDVCLKDFRLVLKYLRNIIYSPVFQVGSKISPKYTFISCISGWFWNISGIQFYLLDFRLVLKYLRNTSLSPGILLFSDRHKVFPRSSFLALLRLRTPPRPVLIVYPDTWTFSFSKINSFLICTCFIC